MVVVKDGNEVRRTFNPCGDPRGPALERDTHMKRTSWILGSMTAFALAACGGGTGGDAGTTGGAGTETGSPGMSADTAPALGPMDTAMMDNSRMDTTTR